MTFPKSLEDLPANTPAQYPGVQGVAHYSEGVFVGYRHYDANNIEPLFPFGHGLSYTTFAYTNLSIRPSSGRGASPAMDVEFELKNTGSRAGAEVAQLYIGDPSLPAVPQPPQQLKAFQRIQLNPGQSKRIRMRLDPRSMAYWDTAAHTWKIAPGVYQIRVGSSSRDIRLQTTFNLSPTQVASVREPAFAAHALERGSISLRAAR